MEKFRPNKGALLPIIGVIILLLVAGGVGVGLRWWQHHREVASGAGKATPTLDTELGELQDLRIRGGFDEAYQQKLDAALDNPKLDNSARYLLYIEQGYSYANKQDYKSAIDVYLKAEALQKTLTIAELLGEAYQQTGNKAKAIEYFKLAITRIPKDRPTAETDKLSYELRIKELGGQP
jgi:tetratricopeptide (TPR) repeat protein